MSKAHDDVQRDGRGQVVTIQPQIPQLGHVVQIVHIPTQCKGTDFCSIDTSKKNTITFNNSFIEIVHKKTKWKHRIIDGTANETYSRYCCC